MNPRYHTQPLSFVDIETIRLKLLTSEMELINDGAKLRVPIPGTPLLPFLTVIFFIYPHDARRRMPGLTHRSRPAPAHGHKQGHAYHPLQPDSDLFLGRQSF